MTLVRVYAPTMWPTDDKNIFLACFEGHYKNIHRADYVIVLRNFNAILGRNFNTWILIGKHGLENYINNCMLPHVCTNINVY